jgi:hypothetical protein
MPMTCWRHQYYITKKRSQPSFQISTIEYSNDGNIGLNIVRETMLVFEFYESEREELFR